MPRVVDLRGNVKLRKKKELGIDEASVAEVSSDWAEAYWNRESNSGYIDLCRNYENNKNDKTYMDSCDKVIRKHPKFISLREFVTNFSKKWKYSPDVHKKYYPYFINGYRYVARKNNVEYYEGWCKFILLSEKPGCYLDNVGKGYESMEAELREFVESGFCPH